MTDDPMLELAGVRFFAHYPKESSCFLCGTNQDMPCILIGVDETASGGIEEVEPVHIQCMVSRSHWRMNRGIGLLYAKRRGT